MLTKTKSSALIVIFLLLLPVFTKPVYGDDIVLRVGIYDIDPLCTTTDIEKNGGLFVRFLKNIARKEKWELRFIPGSVSEGVQRLKSNEIDLLVAAAYNPDLANEIRFSRGTFISTWAQAYTSAQTEVRSILDFANKTVGVVRDDPYNRELRTTIKAFNRNCKYLEFKRSEEIFEALEKGWIDIGIVDRLFASHNEENYAVRKSTVIFSPVELRFAAPKSAATSVLDLIDYHLAQEKADSRSVYSQLINETMQTPKDSILHKILLWGLGITIAVLSFVVFVTVLLRNQVKIKTSELSLKNTELQQEIRMRVEAEDALRKSNEVLNSVIESMLDGLMVIDMQMTTIQSCNYAALNLTGYTEAELLNLSPNLLEPDAKEGKVFLPSVKSALKTKGFFRDEVHIRKKNSTVFPAEMVVTPIRNNDGETVSLVMIIKDITLREQFRQAQKIEAIGTLAGGIAHDFNNLLTPIIGYSELLAMSYSNNSTQKKYLSQILDIASRAKGLVQQILAFSRPEDQIKRPLRLTPLIKETLKLLRATLPTTIHIDFDMSSKSDVILADPTQIHQILMNLCTNAAQAMRDKGGNLRVSVRDHFGPIQGWAESNVLEHGEYIELSVADSGQGIAPEHLHRIYDPFFTTKKKGEGTGMGLSVVHGIIKSYGGLISVDSIPGKGTSFYIYLPKTNGEIDAISHKHMAKPEGGVERILFVDDEEMIAEMASEMLVQLGYNVTIETNSNDALQFFSKKPADFDMIITDYTMPGLTGADFAKAVLEIRPDIPIILCTGYSDAMTLEKAREIGIRQMLNKPFATQDIASTVRKVLDSLHTN
jgi:PAS domain S-box-containing protein